LIALRIYNLLLRLVAKDIMTKNNRTSGTGKLGYRQDIDGLRAIAVICVVLAHLQLGLSGGFVGVDVFFVISGFLITTMIITEIDANNFSLVNFYERRLRRIAPPLIVMVLIVATLGWFLLSTEIYYTFGKSIVAIGVFASNILFARSNYGYFSPESEINPLLHTWSLAVEEQFYLLLPPILLLGWRLGKKPLIAVFIICTTVASLIISWRGASFYLLQPRAWELLVGGLLYFAPFNRKCESQLIKELAATLGLVLILGSATLYAPSTKFPGLAAVAPVFGAALFIWPGGHDNQKPFINRATSWQPFVFIGLISYSLYLWHWPIITLANFLSPSPISYLGRVFLGLFSCGVAYVSWRAIEIPFRARRVMKSRRSLFGGSCIAFACLSIFGLRIYYADGISSRLPTQASILDRTSRIDLSYIFEMESKDFPGNLHILGQANTPPRILVWGDSHAMSLVPAIEVVAHRAKISLSVATHSDTAPLLGLFSRRGDLYREDFCATVFNYASSSIPIKTVVLIANWGRYLDDSNFSTDLFYTIDKLQRSGKAVVFVKDVLSFPYQIPRVPFLYSLFKLDPAPLGLASSEVYRLNARYEFLLPGLNSRHVAIIAPMSDIAKNDKNGTLFPFNAGGSLFRDNEHLSTYGAQALSSAFDRINW
jgi:peptidoglycan/LPS O-acetylase OafA/YrhL